MDTTDRGAARTLDISGMIARHPYQSLAVAVGVGYVLGGGLFTRFTLNAVRFGARVAAVPMVQRELMGAAEALLGSRSGPT